MSACPNCGSLAEQVEALDRGLLEVNARVSAVFTAMKRLAERAGIPADSPLPPHPVPDFSPARERGGLRVLKGGAA
jgi:hypothetical protein